MEFSRKSAEKRDKNFIENSMTVCRALRRDE